MLETRRAWLRRSAPIAALPTVLLGPGHAAAQTASASAGAIHALVFPTWGATPFYYAYHGGLFAKAGIDVTFEPIASGNIGIQGVVAGAAQVSIANTLSLSQAHQHGIPVTVLFGAGVHNAEQPIVWLFVRADGPIRAAKDLEGRTVAITGLHDTLSLSVRAWLAQAGADSTKVRFVELGEPQMLAALQAGRVDAVPSFEPFASAIVDSRVARAIATPYDAIAKQFLVTLWFTYGPWLADNRDAATRFVRVLRDATTYTNAHLVDLLPIVAEYTKMSPETLRHAAREKMAVDVTPAQLQPLIDTAARFGELSAPFPARDLLPP